MDWLTQRIPQALQDFDVPGLSVAVVKDDHLIFSAGFGVRRLGEPAPVDEHTQYGIASISKTFTATALAMLVDEGRLQWDQLLSELLPDFRLMDPFASRELRVRDLLIHNSGLPEVSGGTIWYGSDLDRAEVVRRLRYLRPEASFRSRFAYQNVTFLVAGQLIPLMIGQTWDEFVTARILQPLGMADSNTTLAELLASSNAASPHARLNGTVQPVAPRSHDNVGPAASMNSSAVDLVRYARFHLNGGILDGQRLLSAERQGELWQPNTVIPDQPSLESVPFHFLAYGLGWYVRDYRGRKIVYHSGGVDGYRTLLTLMPEENLAVAALSNQETRITYAVTHSVFDAMLKVEDSDWFTVYAQQSRESRKNQQQAEQDRQQSRVAGTRPSLALETYAGRYFDPLVDDVLVEYSAGSLVLRFSHTPAFTADLTHWHYDTFQLNWRDPYIPNGLVTFVLDSRARPQALLLDQPNLLDVDFRELNLRRREE
jgi:CubicO group peptidase (beta-lactamase class C family)